MNIASTTEPKSDQQNYDDYIDGPKTVTVSQVKAGSAEQPVEVHLVEFPGRPFKPSKSMRRVLVTCWGSDSSAYAGRKLTLFGDPGVTFGGQAVGGIRISALSHLENPVTVSLTVTRGKRAPFVVQPIETPRPKDTSGRDWLTELADTNGDRGLIEALGHAASEANALPTVLTIIRQAYQDAKAGAVTVTQTDGDDA
ncbi:hypothetical protein [Leifsonia poae]|uniref:hypothetical protein n=1 Tax=Leifsonia poae TaxID=110933 RepID=UPI001CBAAB10|nr:hypothetical protein [Leifsonia poae]